MMKIHKPKSADEVKNTISYLYDCHDGSIRKICFIKEREVEQNGSLVYPFADIRDFINCDVEMELLLNCYPTAKKDQIVLLKFIKTRSFTFMQTEEFDYSDIYELKFEGKKGTSLLFCFYATKKMFKALSLSCEKLICEEL